MKFLRAISNLLRFDRTNWKALTLCVFAAAVFWVFNALNKDYSTNLALPLNVEFDAGKFATAEPIPGKLVINVGGNGWELLRKYLGMKVPTVTLALERPVETRKIPASALAPLVVSQLGALQLNYVVLDTLRLHIEPRVSRKVKLTADASSVTFKKNMGRISPTTVMPDSIILEGPRSYMEEFGDTLVVSIKANRVGSNFSESTEVLVDHNEFIFRNPPVVEVSFEVGGVEEIQRQLPVSKIKAQGVDMSRDSISSSWLIAERDRTRFLEDLANISVTLPGVELRKGDTLMLAPILTGVPSYATLIRIDSVELRKHE